MPDIVDIALFGATGFAGRLTAARLAHHLPDGARWAIAGRDRTRLEAIAGELEADGGTRPEVIVADLIDAGSMAALARGTRVLISTVGPYALHGEPAVKACAEAGTDYLDLTGEPGFVDEMWLKYHDVAVASGARLVHACGFDSIPYDLAVLLTVQALGPGAPMRVRGYIRANAKFSGGTFQSAVLGFGSMRQAQATARKRREREPRPAGRKVRGAGGKVTRGLDGKGWGVPLPTIDPLIVLRSARALPAYGPDFSYAHYAQVKKRRTVAMMGVGAGALFAVAQVAPLRKQLLRLAPAGSGPDEARRERSWFTFTVIGESGGRTVRTVAAGGDPGYTETAVMLSESALCLAFDDLPKLSGQLTTAAAMGDALVARLPYFTIT